MEGPETLLGLDIGTTKVAAVIGGRGAQVRVLGAASVPCEGLKHGTVVDVSETTRAIHDAATKAQRMAGMELEAAWVGITGQHISCLNARGEIQLARANREIAWDDVDRTRRPRLLDAVATRPRELSYKLSPDPGHRRSTSTRRPRGGT